MYRFSAVQIEEALREALSMTTDVPAREWISSIIAHLESAKRSPFDVRVPRHIITLLSER